MKRLWLVVLLAAIGCRLDAFGPGHGTYCRWQHTDRYVSVDTMWNTVPNATIPFILVTKESYHDSVQVCRKN